MLSNPSSGRRTAGRLMVLATVAVALPLTATRAINYIDVPAAPTRPESVAPVAAAAAVAQPAQPAKPAKPAEPAKFAALNVKREGKLIVDGQEKDWRDLTPEEKAEIRRSIAHARQELARTRIDREEIRRDIREAMAEARIDQAELRRDLAEARAEIDRAVREVDANAVHIRRSGQDPESIKATIRASLKSVEAIDVEEITRNAMKGIDHAAIEASVAAAEASIARAEAEVERLQQRYEQEE